MRHYASISASTLLLALCACKPAAMTSPSGDIQEVASAVTSAPSNPPAAPTSTTGVSSSLASEIGAECEDAETGRRCTIGDLTTGDFYDIELQDGCSSSGFFAGVIDAKADLLDTLPVTGSKTVVNASVTDGQFLCVRATARAGQKPAYFYVSPLATAQVDACKNEATCSRYGSRPVLQGAQRLEKECTLGKEGRLGGDCPRGWINADAVEPFSNGL